MHILKNIYEINVCNHELRRGFGPVRVRSGFGPGPGPTGFAGSPAYQYIDRQI